MFAALPVLPAGRWLAAAALVVGWLALCAVVAARERDRRRRDEDAAAALLVAAPGESAATGAAAPILIAHASQTGTAEGLAWQTATWLRRAGVATRIATLATLDAALLRTTPRALFIVSTYGEGDPPDSAAPFARRVMADAARFGDLSYAVLALGDRRYPHFRGFGRGLDHWLRDRGARPLFARVDVDNSDPAALATWQRRLGDALDVDLTVANDPAGATTAAARDGRWRVAGRRHLNPGSAGEPVWQIGLVPAPDAEATSVLPSALPSGQSMPSAPSMQSVPSVKSVQPVQSTPSPPAPPLPSWQAGDLFRVTVPADPTRPRDYSISSVMADGRIELLVRRARRPDGSAGVGSGWLIDGLEIGSVLTGRIHPHPAFRLGDNARRPLLLIGNGTGIAGLRALLKARANAFASGASDAGTGGKPDAFPDDGADIDTGTDAAPGTDADPGANASAAIRDGADRGAPIPPPIWLVLGERNAAIDDFHGDEIANWQATGLISRCDRVWSRDGGDPRYVQQVLAVAGPAIRQWIEDGAAIYVCGSLEGMASGVDEALVAALGRDRLDALAVDGRYRRDVY